MNIPQQIQQKNTYFQSDQVIQEQEKGDEQTATWQDAVKYRNKYMVMKKEGDKQSYYNLTCDLEELSQYGPGLRLFFEFIKYSAMAFFLMSLITIPALYSNLNGQSLDSIQLSTNSLAKLSLSNQKDISLLIPASNATDEEFEEARTENQYRIKQFASNSYYRLLLVSIPDLVYSIIFFIFLVWYNIRARQVARVSEQKISVPSHYTIEVSGFPSTIIDPKEISNHFRMHFGTDVFECQLVRNYYNSLFMHKVEARLIVQISSEKLRIKTLNLKTTKKLDKLQSKLQVVQNEINKQIQGQFNGKTLSHNQYPSLKAYVILNNIQDKLRIENEYQKICRILCFSNHPDSFKLHGKHPLQISFKPDEPSNLLWENIEVTSINRFGRTLIVLFLVLIVMLITFGIIIIANIVKPANSSSCPKNTISREEAQNSDLYTNCYCTSVSFSEMTSNKDLQNLCWNTWVKYASTYALSIVTGLVILIVNVILRKTIESLGKFNRYDTITKYTTSMTTKLFLAFFVNTAIITLFLQADIYGFIPAITLSKPIPPLSDLQNDKKQEFSADFDRNWYLSIGTKITVTIFFFIVSHFLFEFILSPVFRYFREKKVKNLVGKDIQRVANKLILGPEFSITFYYASVLNVIFTTLFYASGIPIVIFAGFLILTLQYWVYKYRLLRICRRPPSYDIGLNKRILQIIPWSLFLHLAVGIYMYGQPLIFPKDETVLELVMNKSNNEVYIKTSETSTIKNRAFGVFYLFILLLVILGIYILSITFQSIQNFFSCLCFVKRSVTPISQQVTYNEEYVNIEQRMLSSYNIKMNEQYRYIIHAIDLGKKIDFEHIPRVGGQLTTNYNLKDCVSSASKNKEQLLEDI